jgi:ribose 5-phosphate isomerase B
MKIALGADHRGHEVAAHLADLLGRLGHQVQRANRYDGKSCDYPDVAYQVARAVADESADRGILLCGSGIGMCIAANKVRGVRAALVHDEVGADMSRRHNNANVLCLPADMLGNRFIDRIVQTWLKTDFDGGRHARRVHKITAI